MVRASRDTERMCNGLTVLKTCLCAIVVVTPLGACAGVPAHRFVMPHPIHHTMKTMPQPINHIINTMTISTVADVAKHLGYN